VGFIWRACSACVGGGFGVLRSKGIGMPRPCQASVARGNPVLLFCSHQCARVYRLSSESIMAFAMHGHYDNGIFFSRQLTTKQLKTSTFDNDRTYSTKHIDRPSFLTRLR